MPTLAAAKPPAGPVDITESDIGRRLAGEAAERQSSRRHVQAGHLRVWRLGPGDYLIGDAWPKKFKSEVSAEATGLTTVSMSYEVGSPPSNPEARSSSDAASVSAATWSYVSGACFTRLQNAFGWLDSCYQVHKLKNETDPRDFYKLEQYGSEGAKFLGKIYSGWLGAAKASSSSAMSWIDWSPRGTVTGGCQTIPLSVSALGVSYSASGIMCERWNVYKYADAGHYREEWSCGCLPTLGQPYPNVREIDYLQVISVANGKSAIWTLSAGYQALP
jgi:hypothetical protein